MKIFRFILGFITGIFIYYMPYIATFCLWVILQIFNMFDLYPLLGVITFGTCCGILAIIWFWEEDQEIILYEGNINRDKNNDNS